MAMYDILDRGRTTIRYDFRGVGLSQRKASSYTLDAFVADIEAVVEAAELSRFALRASDFSTGAAIAYATRHPGRVTRMILTRLVTRGTDVMPRANVDGLVALIHGNWNMASQAIADMGNRRSEPTVGIRGAETLRQNMEAEALASMLIGLYETVDVTGNLKDIQCPTLIIHRRDDTPFRFSAAQNAASMIPTARLVPLPGSGPVSVGDDVEKNMQTMAAFLDEDPESRALPVAAAASHTPDNAFRTVLFTDLVGHTEMMSRLGDERGRDVLRQHERITRDVLKAHGGTEVKTMGDGFMASFGSVTRAVECAIALQRAFDDRNRGVGAEQLPDDVATTDDAAAVAQPLRASVSGQTPPEPLHVRVGLNAGEPIEEDGDLFGATVILASRIAAKADGGEILVADTVRGLCSGKRFLFADRGEFVAKGFEEPVRVYEVRWRG